MSKNFHQDYAGSVGRFCRGLPPELGITTQAVDAYFRACALYLWAGSPGGGGGLRPGGPHRRSGTLPVMP